MNEISVEFAGMEEKGPYLYAIIHLQIGQEADEAIGYTNIRISVPITDRGQTLSQLREESLALARQTIQTEPVLAWMEKQRHHC
jgi:hypothetical protein